VIWVATTPLVVVDCETTSKHADEARIIDIAAAYVTPGQPLDLRQSYVDPGMPIPPESIEVHGITDEKIQAEGKPAAEVLDLFLGEIAGAMRNGAVLVIQNARYDATVLACEAARLGIPSLADRLGGPVAPVADPIVIDKRLIKFRSRVSDDQGARILKTLAQIYGVEWDDEQAHGAAYDAIITARVLWKMASWCALPRHELLRKQTCFSASWKKVRPEDAVWFEAVAGMSPMELHDAQAIWYREQTEGLAAHWEQERLQRLAEADQDVPPPLPELPDASDDERRQVLREQADELAEKIAGLRFSWPIEVAR
jgi:DNA polymerase III subunit epsilon